VRNTIIRDFLYGEDYVDLEIKVESMYTKDLQKLISLSRNENYEVRKRVVSNPLCNKEILYDLAKNDKNKYVLSEIARSDKINEETSLSLLNNIYFDASGKSELAQNENISEKIFEILIEDKDEYVRFKTITNKRIPRDLLFKLHNDQSEFIKDVVKDQLSFRRK
jgi:hypothetical protein